MSRRRVVIVAIGALGVSSALFLGGSGPALKPVGRQLVGRWATPELDARAGYVTGTGAVTHPVLVRELRGDRSFLHLITSADDPAISIRLHGGRWSTEPGTVHLEGFGKMGDALREVRERIRLTPGGPM